MTYQARCLLDECDAQLLARCETGSDFQVSVFVLM